MTLDKQAVERLLDMVDELYRKYGVELDAEDVAITQAARNAALVPQEEEVGRMVERFRARLAKPNGFVCPSVDEDIGFMLDTLERLVGIQGK